MIMSFVHDRHFNHCHCSHDNWNQHGVFMRQLICQFKKVELGMYFIYQLRILSVVFDELFEVLVVQLIQSTFVCCLVLTNFKFTDSIQLVAVATLVVVLFVELKIVKMDTTDQVVCCFFFAEAFVCASLRELT